MPRAVGNLSRAECKGEGCGIDLWVFSMTVKTTKVERITEEKNCRVRYEFSIFSPVSSCYNVTNP